MPWPAFATACMSFKKAVMYGRARRPNSKPTRPSDATFLGFEVHTHKKRACQSNPAQLFFLLYAFVQKEAKIFLDLMPI